MKLRAHPPRLLLVVLLAFSAGCAAERDAMEKQLVDLRAEITRLRASEAALTERVGMLEVERGAPGKAEAAPAPGDRPGATAGLPAARADRDRPELDVVRMSPSEGDGDADSDANRPVIRAVGNERPTLTGKTTGARTLKRGVSDASVKKAGDADVRPVVKP